MPTLLSSQLNRILGSHIETIVLDCDLSRSSGTAELEIRYPSRFVNLGVAEQNAMSVAAGLALMGLRPFIHTYAVFASLRAAEQVRTSIAYQRVPVTICATKAGLAASFAGPTHHALEDIAVMRSIPGMAIFAPGTVDEFAKFLDVAIEREGPTYLRVPVDGVPQRRDAVGVGNSSTLLREGSDLALLTTGVLADRCLSIAEELATRNISVRVAHIPGLKPLDEAALDIILGGMDLVITLEEHNTVGGLGSAVAEWTAEHRPARVLRFGVADEFCYDVGHHLEMLDRYLGTPEVIADAITLAFAR